MIVKGVFRVPYGVFETTSDTMSVLLAIWFHVTREDLRVCH